MKKLFTLVALLTCFLGANAVEIEDYKVDYTKKGKTTVGWKADMIQDEWITADEEGLHLYNPEVTANFYDYQLWIFSGATLEVDQEYTVKIVAKVSNDAADVRCRVGDWNGGIAGTVTVNSTEFAEYTYSGKATVASNGLLVQFGDYVGTVTFQSVTIVHEGKEERPIQWQEWLTSDGQSVVIEGDKPIATWMGDAETPWADPNVKFNDQTQNYLICAWSKEKGHNMNDDEGWDPFPANIEPEEGNPSNHVFVCHGQPATTEGDAAAWDNQFWIQSPKNWKAGDQLKIKFRYKASKAVTTNTQIHKQNPSDYKHWGAIGDIAFTTEWQTFDQVVTWPNEAADEGWSIAFNLNPNDKSAIDFYFDNLSWQSMVLEEGFFVAGANTIEGIEFDYDASVKFEEDPDEPGVFVATIGTKSAYVNQVMISTVRGNGAAFRSNTLKPSGTINDDPDEWLDYAAGSNAKLSLPGVGIWKIWIDTNYGSMAFQMLEGTKLDPEDIAVNKTAIVVHGQEREYTEAEAEAAGLPKPEPAGQGWDNQFFLIANRELAAGEVTHLVFKYKANKAAKTSTQCHGAPGAYMHWGCIGDVNFTEEWQTFDSDFTVPAEANNMKSIAFNMAEIKEACDYEITDVQWYMPFETEGKTLENLIDEEGTANFFVKEGAGTQPYQYGTDPSGIANVAAKTAKTSGVIYNLAGQRVANDFKGIVVKDGKKFVK